MEFRLYRNLFQLAVAITLYSVFGCAANESVHSEQLNAIRTSISDPSRVETHVARDAGRRPFEILSLSGIKNGDYVADLAVGSGYYTALASRIVGEHGHVFAVDPTLIFEAFPYAKKTFGEYIEKDPRKNVDYSVQRFDELQLPQPVDIALMALYYHDTVWTNEDRGRMNQAIFDALKPGGIFLIVDHHAQKGSDESVTKDLHRMDATSVVPEITDVGFVMETQSNILRNSDDPRDVSVFDPEWRGKTDRFIFVFRKPRT